MAEAIPFCVMPGYERYVSELFIPPTELRVGERVVDDYRENRLEMGKTRFPQCSSCRFEPLCEGPWRQYPEKLGHDEFVPVPGARVWDGEVVRAGMLEWLGRAVPRAALEAHGGGRVEVPAREGLTLLCFYPEDASPGCTQQFCSLRDDDRALREAGVTVFGVNPASRERHAAFASAHGLSATLLVDEDARLAAHFGVGGRGGVARRSFLLDADGAVLHVFPDVDTRAHGAQVLALLARMRRVVQPRPAVRRLPLA
jgi:peroxiredoxin Q/BCP